jgi:hypothetical protein
MRFLLPTLLLAAVWTGGCATRTKPDADATTSGVAVGTAGAATRLIVTPEAALTGRVSAFNDAGRFAVLDFPVGRVPAIGRTLFTYRQGLKVGELKVTGPERDHNTVADLVSGEARAGDEVRDQ